MTQRLYPIIINYCFKLLKQRKSSLLFSSNSYSLHIGVLMWWSYASLTIVSHNQCKLRTNKKHVKISKIVITSYRYVRLLLILVRLGFEFICARYLSYHTVDVRDEAFFKKREKKYNLKMYPATKSDRINRFLKNIVCIGWINNKNCMPVRNRK